MNIQKISETKENTQKLFEQFLNNRRDIEELAKEYTPLYKLLNQAEKNLFKLMDELEVLKEYAEKQQNQPEDEQN